MMSRFDFESLLAKTLTWWPTVLKIEDHGSNSELSLDTLALFYEDNIQVHADKSGSRLQIQLDWILFDAVAKSAEFMSIVRPGEIRRAYLKERLHLLLSQHAVPQLLGSKDADDSFDLVELSEYLKWESLD